MPVVNGALLYWKANRYYQNNKLGHEKSIENDFFADEEEEVS